MISFVTMLIPTLIVMAKKMPVRLQAFCAQLIGNRIHWLTIGTVFVFALQITAYAEPKNRQDRTLQILQMGFAQKDENTQRILLREMALTNNSQAIPFFVSVSIDPKYSDQTRSEAIKGMIAIDSKKYRPMLEVLQTSTIQDDKLIRNLQLVEGLDLFEPFLNSLTFQEPRRIIDMKLSVILASWKNEPIRAFDFSAWPSEEASEVLFTLIQSTNKTEQRVHLIELWGKVRNDKTTKEMVKWLDQPNEKVQEALILALSEPGPNAVPALGRFLQKSKNPILRKRAIFAMRKINSDTSKLALKAYLPQANLDEKKWIEEILK